MPLKFLPVTPKGFGVDPTAFKREMSGALDHSINIINDEYKKTYATWKRKPQFVKDKARVTGTGMEAVVYTTNPIFAYVDLGTSAHPITARRAPSLAFRWPGFKAKTIPGKITSYAGARATGPLRRPKSVQHPGFPGRDFTVTISNRKERNTHQLLREAFTRSLVRQQRL